MDRVADKQLIARGAGAVEAPPPPSDGGPAAWEDAPGPRPLWRLPHVRVARNGLTINGAALALIPTSLHVTRATVRLRRAAQLLAIVPAAEGNYKFAIRARGNHRDCHVGGPAVTEWLHGYGVQLGSYPARWDGDRILVDLRKGTM